MIAALAAALLPVLILGALQSAIGFQREGRALRQNLGFAAERSAATRGREWKAPTSSCRPGQGEWLPKGEARLAQVTTRRPAT